MKDPGAYRFIRVAGCNQNNEFWPARMSEAWPPVDLIAGLSLETTAKPESELDEKVKSGNFSPSLLIMLSSIVHLSQLPVAFGRTLDSDPSSENLLIILGYHLELPRGTEVLEITPSGASAWVQTVRIRTRQKDGTSKDFFKKVHHMYYNRTTLS